MSRLERGAWTALVPALALASSLAYSQEQRTLEEVIVTARKQAETLQDVPVTVAAFSEEDLDRYNITSLTDAATLVPNFQINHTGSGNNSNLYLRGIGSSSISAAFDQSVAINIDGVIASVGRLIANGYLDMAQIEVLKGPQSLYFGKSATAGVVSITTNDPGDEVEIQGMAGYETELDQTYTELILSAPLTDTFGARLAVGTRNSDEMFHNITPGVQNEWRGEETVDGRLTLLWKPTDSLRARGKIAYSKYEDDGPNSSAEEICPEGQVQPTVALGVAGMPGVYGALGIGFDDCKLNGNTSIADLFSPLAIGNPIGNGGIPYTKQDTYLYSLELDWDINDQFALTSISAYVDMETKDFDVYDYNAGMFGGAHRNLYESFTQELRLDTDFDGPLNFMVGAFYQDVTQEFNAYQYAVNIGLVAADPITGNGYDYNKNHFLDTEVWSGFLAAYWDITDKLELTAGVRYTDEQKDGYITIPYVHAFLQGVFSAPAFVPGLTFDDENWSPEVAVNYYLTDDVSVFASYKQGFKSGGIDNSALPSNSLAGTPEEIAAFLVYQSEEAKGFEVGIKANLLDGSMRLNGTIFDYDYSDLQVQQFDSEAIQFFTSNASKLNTHGAELDLLWLTPVDGLSLRSALAYTDAEYKDDFFNPDGQNLKGQRPPRNAKFAGSGGFTYDMAVGDAWRLNVSTDLRYNDGYNLINNLDPFKQSSFWLVDAAIRMYSANDRYELALIGRNLSDKNYAYSAGNRPGACVRNSATFPGLGPTGLGGVCAAGVTNNEQDQVVPTARGRQYTLQFRVRL